MELKPLRTFDIDNDLPEMFMDFIDGNNWLFQVDDSQTSKCSKTRLSVVALASNKGNKRKRTLTDGTLT
mgnify:CR=1 FL=1